MTKAAEKSSPAQVQKALETLAWAAALRERPDSQSGINPYSHLIARIEERAEKVLANGG